MMIDSYRDLKVWQEAVDLVVESYRIAKLLPKSGTYGLVSQIQRSATSIPANIAEGHGMEHLGDYLRHLSIANGSLIWSWKLISWSPGNCLICSQSDLEPILSQTAEVGRMLAGLTKKFKALMPGG